VAALTLGYRFVGVEKTAHYFDIACRRLEQVQADLFEQEMRKPAQVAGLFDAEGVPA
jgi:DNA modification methylase